jgi:hypothetical protein
MLTEKPDTNTAASEEQELLRSLQEASRVASGPQLYDAYDAAKVLMRLLDEEKKRPS